MFAAIVYDGFRQKYAEQLGFNNASHLRHTSDDNSDNPMATKFLREGEKVNLDCGGLGTNANGK